MLIAFACDCIESISKNEQREKSERKHNEENGKEERDSKRETEPRMKQRQHRNGSEIVRRNPPMLNNL